MPLVLIGLVVWARAYADPAPPSPPLAVAQVYRDARSPAHTMTRMTDGTVADAGVVVTSVNGQAGDVTIPAGPQGPAGPTGAQGAAGLETVYGTSGLIANYRCVQANVITASGGVWSLPFNAATFPGFVPFSSAPNVQPQAVSASNLLAGLYFATNTAPTVSAVNGAVTLAGIGGLGPSGITVQVRACGS